MKLPFVALTLCPLIAAACQCAQSPHDMVKDSSNEVVLRAVVRPVTSKKVLDFVENSDQQIELGRYLVGLGRFAEVPDEHPTRYRFFKLEVAQVIKGKYFPEFIAVGEHNCGRPLGRFARVVYIFWQTESFALVREASICNVSLIQP